MERKCWSSLSPGVSSRRAINGEVGGKQEIRKPTLTTYVFSMASSQNLPAVLNDPSKGKQKDFFTRTWGESFSDMTPLPFFRHFSSSNLSTSTFDKYLRKLNKYRSARRLPESSKRHQPPSLTSITSTLVSSEKIPHMLWDPNLSMSNQDTFSRVMDEGKKLPQHLDAVEVDIAVQVSRKSHHFFEVMAYHDALMNRLQQLVQHVRNLRGQLDSVNAKCFKRSLEICRLRRRRTNLAALEEKLAVMSHLRHAQPKIQLLLSRNEFGPALDLIRASRDVLNAQGVASFFSFRHLPSQLDEIQSIIGKMLLGDFQTYISDQIYRGGDVTCHERASVICQKSVRALNEDDTNQLESVIFGLLRQNSLAFLEVLEGASVSALKNAFREIAVKMLVDGDGDKSLAASSTTLTCLASDFAQRSSSREWTSFFDYLLGSVISLLHRIHAIHSVIAKVINDAATSFPFLFDEQQVKNLRWTSHEVLVNVCDQAVERSSKILTQRSRPDAAKNVTVDELRTMFELAELLRLKTAKAGSRVSLHLTLQSQTLIFVQNFHERKRTELSGFLEEEKWKKSDHDERWSETLFGDVAFRFDGSGRVAFGDATYVVTGSALSFLSLLHDYCQLSSELPSASSELGFKAAEIIKFFNSRTCQLVLGVGAISVSGLKTITIRNMALAKRSLELIVGIVPLVRRRFNGANDDAKTLRQLDQAVGHLTNHVSELQGKILAVVERVIWQHVSSWKQHRGGGGGSANFKALCKQLLKLHDSLADVWPGPDVENFMVEVHQRFMDCARAEIDARNMHGDEASAFQAELASYSSTLASLNVVPDELLSKQRFKELLWPPNDM